MRYFNSRNIFIFLSISLYILAVFLLLNLNVQGIKYPYFDDYNIETVSLLKGVYAIFGGTYIIKRGYFIKNDFVENPILTKEVNFRFDYITFFFVVLTFISILCIFIFYYQKRKLLFSLIILLISIVGVSFEPTFFYIVSGGPNDVNICFSPNMGNGILGIGAIAYVCIIACIAIFVFIRLIYLYSKKITID